MAATPLAFHAPGTGASSSSGGPDPSQEGQLALVASQPQNKPPFFIAVFGGLGLYGGHDDFFLFLQRVMAHLHSSSSSGAAAAVAAAGKRQYRAVGAQEMARLATQAGQASTRPK